MAGASVDRITDDGLEVRATTLTGFGVFARRAFSAGEVLIQFRGPTYTYDEIVDGSYLDDHCIQTGLRTYMGPSGGVDDFFNHSCSPNSGVRTIDDRLILVAITDIPAGTEITWDYSTYMNENCWTSRCVCGSPDCRGTITDFRLLPEALKEKYRRLNIVGTFVTG